MEQFTLLLDTALEEISVTLSNAEAKVTFHSGKFITKREKTLLVLICLRSWPIRSL